MRNFYKICLWGLCATMMISVGFSLINKASTIANIVGVFWILALVFISDKTKFFTNLKIKNRNEKND